MKLQVSCLILLLGALTLPLEIAEARGWLRTGLQKATQRALQLEQAYARDRLRDAATPARPLAQPRRVQRYTSAESAAHAQRAGLPPDTHMTSSVARGRGLSAETAQQRFGLRTPPERVLTIELPAGTPIRSNRVLAGAPGQGEITSPQRIPPNAIKAAREVRPRARGAEE
ncbi:MAG: hypothetical protein MUE46_11820 [Xanthomonadales bacterium]|nr:hypothetical protein [Xanthomonadales bacterium]